MGRDRVGAWRRPAVGIAAVLVLLGAVAVGVGVYRHLSPGVHGAAASAAVPRPATSTATPTGADAAAAEALRSLDLVRSAAYAGRSPDALAGVYDSDALLAADRRQLVQVVPVGCGLQGLRTSFSGLRANVVPAGPDRPTDLVVVTAQAVVSAARIVCHGTVVSHVPARPRALMTIVLRSSAADGGLRIAVMGTG